MAALSIGCSPETVLQQAEDTPPRPAGDITTADAGHPHKIATKHLPNPVQVHPKVISGGLPEGDRAFQELQDLGVKTVISVDGARPDVAIAKKYGLRYVHLPHGYDGVPENRIKELAKAVRDLDGPVYIHCHHGKHRSPAAASVACVAAGLIPQVDGLSVLKIAGTSPNYRGLYESARTTTPFEDALLDELDVEFRESMEVPPMAEAMVALEHTHDHLKAIAAAGWRSPGDHPDLDPAHEALLFREHFTELLRTDYVQQKSEEFQQLMRGSEEAAQKLEDTLRQWQPTESRPAPPPALEQIFTSITADCKTCHQKFRDVPLSEK
ncbi:protein-tyrosine phosphatase family protein [Adhaeretor mobilis]|nr:cytochrome c [Adhaeretor mobilis]